MLLARPSPQQRQLPHEDMHYRHGPIDIQIYGVDSFNGGVEYGESFRRSLRVSDVSDGKLLLPPHNLTERYDSVIKDDRLYSLCHLMAPDVFRFKIQHRSLVKVKVRVRVRVRVKVKVKA